MLDPKFIRDNVSSVKENTKKRIGSGELVDKFVVLDKRLRELQLELDSSRHSRNKISESINEAKKSGNNHLFQQKVKEAKELPEKIKKAEEEYSKLEQETKAILSKIPNIMHKSVPLGKDASQNKEIKRVGSIPKFNFPVKNHVELAEKLGIADFEASARVSGNGFYYLKKELALLNQALIRFTIDFMSKKGYEYIETPLMLNEKSIYASMDKNAFEQSVYSIKGEDLNLIGTSEQSILAMHSDEVFNESDLPKRYFSYSMCFRKEVGAHGINEKGLWRTHQFNKVEQFIFCKPEDSEKMYDELFKNSDDLLRALGLPYRWIEICSGDLASWKNRSADFEVWRPTTKSYGELGSLSNCTDYQARKLNIKIIRNNNQEKQVVHTLNNTGLATSRTIVAILENCQEKDGSVKIPAVLQKYTGFKIIKPQKEKPEPRAKIKTIKLKKTKKKK